MSLRITTLFKSSLKSVVLVCWVLLMLLINGCVGQPAVPQDYFYRLPVVHPASPLQAPLVNGTVAVDQFNADGVYRDRPLLYVDAERPLEVLQYHYRHWIQVPTSLIQDNMVEYLREANVAERVERYSGGRRTEWLITGRLQKFERVVEQDRATAVVEIEMELRQRNQNGLHKRIEVYSSQVQAAGPSIHDTVTAFGDALQRIYDAMLSDINNAQP